MPLGLHHMIGGDHYAPQPWNDQASEADWTATYYHQASTDGIGFDRTKHGDRAVEQYFPPVCDTFDDIARCPEKLLLWFHRCAWDYKMKSGKTLWDELCAKYYEGTRSKRRRCKPPGNRSRAKLMRAGTRKWPTAWPFKLPTRRSGATRFWNISAASAKCRFHPG